VRVGPSYNFPPALRRLTHAGFSSEVLGPIIKQTLFNPAVTLPLLLLARYTKQGEIFAILHPTILKRVRTLLYLGLARWINNYLSRRALNNWVTDTYNWEKEIVVITGGAGGIGGHVVRLLAEHKMTVVVLDIIPMTFETPSNVHYYKCDITSTSAIQSTASQIRKAHGDPTILINNAGVARGRSILDSTEKDIRFTFDVNAIAHYMLVKEFLPSMIAANHGMIVTVASVAAFVTVADMVDYAATKAAALSFHEGLTAELAGRYNVPSGSAGGRGKSKVRTIVIQQGYTRTPLFEGYANGSPFMMPTLEPETVAEGIVRQVLRGESGQVIMPGYANMLSFFRGFPHWMQLRVRNGDGEKIMRGWRGRQVVDVDREYKVKSGDLIKQDSNGESG
jgi:all-trans-retinol dehydrogenase (NAD+)